MADDLHRDPAPEDDADDRSARLSGKVAADKLERDFAVMRQALAAARKQAETRLAMLQKTTQVLEKTRETLEKRNAVANALQRRLSDVALDKAALELHYYKQYFSCARKDSVFQEQIDELQNLVSQTVESAQDRSRLIERIERLGASARPAIPSLRPYPRIPVDLGLRESCGPACRDHRRRIVSLMPTAFNGTRAMAILDLSRFTDGAAYREAVRKTSKGNVIREARRAHAHGLRCRMFDPADFVDDMHAIIASKPTRQGEAMRPPYDQDPADLMATFRSAHANPVPACPRHHGAWLGIFQPRADAADRLLGFILLERNGDFVHYRHILGHGDWLAEGIMFALHFYVVDWLYETQPGLRAVSYAGWTDLPDQRDPRPGLTRWKKKTLFQPMTLMEAHSETREALLQEIVANSKNKIFPDYVVDGIRSAACLYCAALMGQRDLIHFFAADVAEMTLVDHDAAMMAELRKAYPEKWSYRVDDAFAFVRDAAARKVKYDVVTLDPWVYLQMDNIAMIKDIVSIANRHVVISLTSQHFFGQNHVKPTAESVFKYFRALDARITSVDVVKSTDHAGGLYWCVLQIGPVDARPGL